MRCPVCRNECRLAGSLHDDRYGFPGDFPLYGCASCGHKFVGAEFSEEVLRKLYSEYYPRSSRTLESYRVPEEKAGLKLWLQGDMCSPFRWVPEKVKVLDIGCGFGESLGYYEKRGCEAYGVEADENIRRIAGRFGFKV